jgi:hypothetical protein
MFRRNVPPSSSGSKNKQSNIPARTWQGEQLAEQKLADGGQVAITATGCIRPRGDPWRCIYSFLRTFASMAGSAALFHLFHHRQQLPTHKRKVGVNIQYIHSLSLYSSRYRDFCQCTLGANCPPEFQIVIGSRRKWKSDLSSHWLVRGTEWYRWHHRSNECINRRREQELWKVLKQGNFTGKGKRLGKL